MAALICKIAFRTIPRLGIFALILLTVCFYFLFSAGHSLLQIKTEKNTPYELSARATGNYIEANQLLNVEGVERVSPVLRYRGTLQYRDYQLNTEVTAVYSNFPQLSFADGIMYPDNSNMAYLVLNETAAETFMLENEQIAVGVNDVVDINVDGITQTATICGIYTDGSDIPMVYMSYDTARRLFGQNNDAEILLLISNVGAVPKAIRSLERYRLAAEYDTNSNMMWELLQQQAFQTALSAFLIAVCAVAIIRERNRIENEQQRSEIAALQSSGLSNDETDLILPVRCFFSEIGCLMVASMIAVGSGVFSVTAVVVCMFVGIVMLFGLFDELIWHRILSMCKRQFHRIKQARSL